MMWLTLAMGCTPDGRIQGEVPPETVDVDEPATLRRPIAIPEAAYVRNVSDGIERVYGLPPDHAGAPLHLLTDVLPVDDATGLDGFAYALERHDDMVFCTQRLVETPDRQMVYHWWSNGGEYNAEHAPLDVTYLYRTVFQALPGQATPDRYVRTLQIAQNGIPVLQESSDLYLAGGPREIRTAMAEGLPTQTTYGDNGRMVVDYAFEALPDGGERTISTITRVGDVSRTIVERTATGYPSLVRAENVSGPTVDVTAEYSMRYEEGHLVEVVESQPGVGSLQWTHTYEAGRLVRSDLDHPQLAEIRTLLWSPVDPADVEPCGPGM